MKVLKYLLMAVVSVAVLVVLAAVFVAATFDPNKYKPEITSLVKDKTGRTLSIEGNIGLSFFPSIGVSVGKVSLSEPNSDRIFARIGEARISLALLPLLSKQVVVDRVTLSGLAVDLVQRKGGKTNFSDLAGASGGSAPAPRQAPQREPVRLDVAGIDIRSSAIEWHDEASGNQFKATIAELKTGRIASGVPGKLSLAARVEASQPKADYQIQLSGGYRLDFEKQAVALSGIDLKISDGAAGAKVPPTAMQGDVEFDLVSQAIRFNLAVDRLDLDRYLPPPTKAGVPGSAKAPAGASAGGTEAPINLSALKGLNLKGGLKIGQLVASNVKLEKVNVGMQAAGGKVEINPLAATLYEGNLTGNAGVNANTNQFVLKARLGGVSIGPLLHDALNNDLLQGRGNVALDVQTGGHTMSAMKKALSGSASVALRDSALKGVNLGETLRKLKSLGGSKPTAEQEANRAEKTDFTELSASFVIKNGVAHNDDLSGKSPLIRLAGSGDVNVGADALDYLAKASVVGTATGQGGRELADLRGITIPVRITGPLDAPKFRIELGNAAGQAAKKEVEEKVKEKLQDRLKGLLRR